RLGHLRVSPGQRTVLLLQLGEQTHVLDGDHGLVSEGLQELDLTRSEELGLAATEVDGADGRPFPHQGHAQDRVLTYAPRDLRALRELFRLGLQVAEVNRPSVQDRAAAAGPADQRDEGLDGDGAAMGSRSEAVAVPEEDDGVERFAQSGCALDYGIEHGLDIGGRAADHPQDLARRRLLLRRLSQFTVARVEMP